MRANIASTPPSSAQSEIVASSPLALAIQGYMSAVTSSPAARAASIRPTTSFIRPQFARPETLRCQISTDTRASRAMVNASSSASPILFDSLRM